MASENIDRAVSVPKTDSQASGCLDGRAVRFDLIELSNGLRDTDISHLRRLIAYHATVGSLVKESHCVNAEVGGKNPVEWSRTAATL
jgi:phosphosulfolactate synthase (CoM biosynthesis protein A)